MDHHTNTTYRGGSHLHPIFDPLDSEYDGMILGLLYLLQLAPGSVLILPDSATLLHILRRPLRLSRPIDERVSRILDLINDLLTARFFLRFRWVPGHRNPSESLLYYGNSQADLEAGAYLARPTLHTTAIHSKLWRLRANSPPPTAFTKLGKTLLHLPCKLGRTLVRLATNHSRLKAWPLRMALSKRNRQTIQADYDFDRLPRPASS